MFGEFNLNVRESHRHRAGGGSPEGLMLTSEAQVGAEPGSEDTRGRAGGGQTLDGASDREWGSAPGRPLHGVACGPPKAHR